MTATTEASEALARLREVVKPGGTIYVDEERSRTRDTCRVRLRAIEVGGDGIHRLARPTRDVADVLDLRVADDGRLVLSGHYDPAALLDRLSVALFGEPGQIRGEYL